MSNSYLVAATLLAANSPTPPPVLPPIDNSLIPLQTNTAKDLSGNLSDKSTSGVVDNRSPIFREPSPLLSPALTPALTPEFSPLQLNFPSALPAAPQTYLPPPELLRPKSGSQLLFQRVAALQAGITYTRVSTDSFAEYWQKADPREPTYEQWQSLLIQEAKALAQGQGNNSLSVIVGDSLSMWFPADKLPQNGLWLNQGISGENTTQILRRLKYRDFAQTRPSRIYVMAGINDIRQGEADQTILANHRQIMRQLHRDYPQAEIIVQSILPTRFAAIPDRRLRYLNQQLAMIAAQEGVSFANLYDRFLNQEGQLRRELTTDGLHLSMAGYDVWSSAIGQNNQYN